jgi:methylmalonyl-CoA/ethylmalonyl-CoA epimerase
MDEGMMAQDGSMADEAPRSLFQTIDHVGVAVHDLDAATKWYTETFGMRVVHTEVNEEQGVREAMLSVGSGGGPLIQLVAPLNDASPVARFLTSRGEGLHQVAYAVDDVDAATATLRERGLDPVYPQARRGTAGTRVNFLHPKSAGGILVELVERPPHQVEQAERVGPRPTVRHPGETRKDAPGEKSFRSDGET